MRSQPLFFVAHRVKAGGSLSKRVMGGSNKVSDPAVKSLVIVDSGRIDHQLGVSKNMGKPPNHPF